MKRPGGWRLELLGRPRLLGGAGEVWFPEGSALALLSLLALDGPSARARLAPLLWPEAPGEVARNNLVHLIRRVNRVYGPLLHAGDRVALAEQVEVDAALLSGGLPAGDLPERLGTLLDGVSFDDRPDLDDWLLAWRERLAGRQAAALADQAGRQEAAGELGAALDTTQRLLDLDPLSEAAWLGLLRLHYLAGDRGAALRAYQRCRDTLERELGAEPGAQLRALAARIDRGEALPGQTAARPALPLAVLRPPQLVGREAAWAQMEAAWAAGQVLYLTGEAGIGKTRFAQDFVNSKGRALYLPGHAGAQGVPFAAAAHNARARLAATPALDLPEWVRRELSRLLPELRRPEEGPPLPISSEAARLTYYLAHLELVRLSTPGVAAVITDDVQYYDPATVELGAFFLSQGRSTGAAGEVPRHVIIYRTGSLPELTQRRIDALVAAGLAARIELGGLSTQALETLLQDVQPQAAQAAPDLAQELQRLTQGNPQFVLETLRHLLQDGEYSLDGLRRTRPGGLAALIQERLARLSPAARQTAQGAAVLQDSFSLELLAEVLGSSLLDLASAWEELEAAQLVRGERFSHDTLREAVLGGLPASVRTLLHRASARVLARHQAHPARVARHWLDAGEVAQAAPWLMRAGAAAEDSLRPAEAAEHYAGAAQAYAQAGDPAGESRARQAHQQLLRAPQARPVS